MTVFTINRYAQYINGQQLIHRLEHVIDQTGSNIPIGLAAKQRGRKYLLVDFQHLFQVITINQTVAEIQNIITHQQYQQNNHTKNDSHRLIIGRKLHPAAILLQ